jgi:hypothetical protein
MRFNPLIGNLIFSIAIQINRSNCNHGIIVKPIDQFSYATYSIHDEMKLNSLLSLIVQNDKLNVIEELQHEFPNLCLLIPMTKFDLAPDY